MCFSGEKHTVRSDFFYASRLKSKFFLSVDILCFIGDKFVIHPVIGAVMVLFEKNRASETPFKERFRNHKIDFKHLKYEKCTEPLKYIWSLKSQGVIPKI